MRLARLASIAMLTAAACAGPRVPPPLPASKLLDAPPVPEALPAADPTLLAVARARDPLELLRKLGLDPDTLGLMLPGFKPAELHPGALTGFVWAPPAERAFPVVLGLLPTASDSSVAQALQSRFDGLQLRPLGGDTLAAMEPAALDKGLQAPDSLRSMAQAPLQDDVQLHVAMKAVMARYRPTLDRFLAVMKAAAAARGPDDTSASMKAMLEGLEALDSLTLGARVLPDAFLGSVVTRAKEQPAPVAEMPLSQDLVRYLPPGSLRMLANGRFLRRSYDWIGNMNSGAFGDPKFSAAFRDNLDEWVKNPKLQAAVSFSLSKEKLFRIVQVVSAPGNADALLETMIKGSSLLGDPAMQAGLSQRGLSCKNDLRRGARQVEGWPVDHLEVDCKLSASAAAPHTPPAVAKMLARLYPMVIEAARVGDFLVVEVNGGGGADLDRMVRELLSGKPSGQPLAAAATFPERSFLLGDLDLAMLSAGVDGLMAEAGTKTRLPPLDPALPKVTTTAFEAGGVTQYRVLVPKAVVGAISAASAALKAGAAKDSE